MKAALRGLAPERELIAFVVLAVVLSWAWWVPVALAGGSPGHLLGPIATILRVAVLNGLVRQRLRPLPSTWAPEHLLVVTDLVETGQVTPVLDQSYPLADTAAALRHVEDGHARGKVVITVT